jgi:hypothetical protein
LIWSILKLILKHKIISTSLLFFVMFTSSPRLVNLPMLCAVMCCQLSYNQRSLVSSFFDGRVSLVSHYCLAMT